MNPFYLTADIPEEYFCDREKETSKLTNYLINGVNVTLISPRRMGKSGLINHMFRQKVIKENYQTLYLDILQSSSLKEFVYLFGKAVYESIVPKTMKWTRLFFQILKSLNGKITIDSLTGLPTFNILIGEITEPQYTLDEIFKFLKEYGNPCIIAIDEFQQITRYPETNVEALIRSYIQQQNNSHFIFSGSERHIMQEMFFSYSRPFYNSTSVMVVEQIPKQEYIDFSIRNFKNFNKEITEASVSLLYDQFDGYTYYLQKVLNEAFSALKPGEKCDTPDLRQVIINILEDNSTIYREILSNIPEKQKELLYALAIEGEAQKITSSEFIKKYNLKSQSSVQSAAKVLLEKDYITKQERKYFLSDKFFSLWIRNLYGNKPISLLES